MLIDTLVSNVWLYQSNDFSFLRKIKKFIILTY